MKAKILYVVGLLVSIFPPCYAVIEYIPLWVKRGSESTLSALAIILIAMCCIPFWRTIKNALKSPSPWMLWGIVLLFSLVTKNIIDQVYTIALIAFPSAIIGSVLFYLSKRVKEKAAQNG